MKPPAPIPAQNQVPRLPSLTGLRFLAALGVFAFHSQSMLPPWTFLRPLLTSGQSGVSFFFLLSGFVLTWSAAATRPTARTFWRRRAARILPSYLLTWVMGIPVTFVAFGAWPTAWAVVTTGTLTQSWIDEKSIFFGVNGVGWSLSCEMLFYAAFPLLLRWVTALVPRSLLGTAGVCVALMAVLSAVGFVIGGAAVADQSGTAFWVVSILPLSRLPEFLIGMVAARAVRLGSVPVARLRWAVPLAGAAGYVAALFPTPVVAGWLTAVPFTFLICAAAGSDLRGQPGPLSRRWLVRLGTWSFAFYLTHQLVIRLSAWLWPVTSALLLHLVVDLAAAMAVSAVLHYGVEVPAERRWRGAAVEPAANERVLDTASDGYRWVTFVSHERA